MQKSTLDTMQDIHCIDKYWRVANYLTVSTMYLYDNLYLKRKLKNSDIRQYAIGHWGTCPGINFIYAHINRYVKQYRRKTQIIIGPGHAGNALAANIQMESYVQTYNLSNTENMLPSEYNNLQQSLSNVRSEISPFYPGTIYDGGELGYSLAVAFGSVLDTPDALCVCIIGDGELETGTLSASWNCIEYLDRSSGFVLPIIHLNGYRMGNKSLLSRRSDEDLISIFQGLGYNPFIVEADHQKMYDALDWVECTYREIEQDIHNEWPLLIFKSPKGWTAPAKGDFHVENSLLAHKNPLRNMHSLDEKRKYLFSWLKSYVPDELFDENGKPREDALSIIPEMDYRLGNSLRRYVTKKLSLPDIMQFYLTEDMNQKLYGNITILEKYLGNIIQANPSSFRIMSPDELQSNLLNSLKTVSHGTNEIMEEDNGRVLEILNENICQGWMQGYNLTGHHSLMISYEAFMPVITSMVSQYAKWLFQSNKVQWRQKTSSMTYILTSLCWANTFSHQNPEFINSLLSLQYPFIRIYTPSDANCLLACMEDCLLSEARINAIVTSKQRMPQWFDYATVQSGLKMRLIQYNWLPKKAQNKPDVILVAAGDYLMRECMEALTLMKELFLEANVKLLSILELTSIGSVSVYPHAMDNDTFNRYFCDDIPVLFCFHGYPSAIKMLLYDRIESRRLTILGYDNQSIYSADDLHKLMMNGCSRYDIVLHLTRLLHQNNKITEDCFTRITDIMREKLMQKVDNRC